MIVKVTSTGLENAEVMISHRSKEGSQSINDDLLPQYERWTLQLGETSASLCVLNRPVFHI